MSGEKTESAALKPRLLMVSTTFPRWEADAGPAPFVFDLAVSLKKYFEVTVLAPHYPSAARHELWNGLEIFRFRYLPDRYETLASGEGIQNKMRKNRWEMLKLLPFLAGEFFAGWVLLRKRKFDAINSHWMVPSGWIFARLSRKHKTPHFITVHAADYFLLNRMIFGKALMRRTVKSARAVLPVNQMMADGIQRVCGDTRIKVMPMGFDPKKFRNGDQQEVARLRDEFSLSGKKIILFVGKLSQKKGVANLVHAIKLLSNDFPNFQLVVVGRGGYKPSLERLASKLGITYRVRFIGAVPHKKVPAFYQLAEVVAVPSLPDKYGETEGMPVVVLEALASGKPVVGSSYCSVPEPLKHGGFLEVEEPTAEALAAALKQALNGEFKADFSAVDKYSWEEVARFYAEVISG